MILHNESSNNLVLRRSDHKGMNGRLERIATRSWVILSPKDRIHALELRQFQDMYMTCS